MTTINGTNTEIRVYWVTRMVLFLIQIKTVMTKGNGYVYKYWIAIGTERV